MPLCGHFLKGLIPVVAAIPLSQKFTNSLNMHKYQYQSICINVQLLQQIICNGSFNYSLDSRYLVKIRL